MALILVVDDVIAMAEQYAYDLKRIGGYETLAATSGKEALEIVAREAVDCMILDLEMPGFDGFEVIRSLREQSIEIPIIVYTGTGNYDRCTKAIKLGAYSFIDKVEPMERVVREVENALKQKRLEAEVKNLKRDLGRETPILGKSEAIMKLKEQIMRLASIDTTVLVTGESGTGKELVAREIHRLGGGELRPFVALNCGALPENLMESELFGHERGAFTGANRLRRGAFELAHGGVLFLDEIGEIPLGAQAKLLRVLEEREIMRVGGERPVKVNARVVAATNRDLEREVEAKRFRQDLYYRLNVSMIRVPPLRDHRSDIPELAEHFLAEACRRFGISKKRISPEAMDCLMNHEWKRNNVRELKNVVERLIIASSRDVIGWEEIPSELRSAQSKRGGSNASTLRELKTEAERRIIIAALERNDWHITQTAKELGLADHASLLKIMRRHNIRRKK